MSVAKTHALKARLAVLIWTAVKKILAICANTKISALVVGRVSVPMIYLAYIAEFQAHKSSMHQLFNPHPFLGWVWNISNCVTF